MAKASFEHRSQYSSDGDRMIQRAIVSAISERRQANANSFIPASADLHDADIDRVGGSRLKGKGATSPALHCADLGAHRFQPGRHPGEKRIGAEYWHVRALLQSRQKLREKISWQVYPHSRTVL